MLKQGLSIDTNFYPPLSSLDTTFNLLKLVLFNLKSEGPLNFTKNIKRTNTRAIPIDVLLYF
jgi:hypothetical protein